MLCGWCFSCSFFNFWGPVYKSQLCWSGWSEKKQDPPAVSRGWGNSSFTPSPSIGEALLALARASLRDRVMQTKWRCSSRVCVKLFSGLLVPLCCWSFLRGLQGSPGAIFVRGYYYHWSILGIRGLLLHHLGDINL